MIFFFFIFKFLFYSWLFVAALVVLGKIFEFLLLFESHSYNIKKEIPTKKKLPSCSEVLIFYAVAIPLGLLFGIGIVMLFY